MIKVRVSLDQLKVFLRQIAPKLTIQQRMKLLRELARDDLSSGAPRRRDDTPVAAPAADPRIQRAEAVVAKAVESSAMAAAAAGSWGANDAPVRPVSQAQTVAATLAAVSPAFEPRAEPRPAPRAEPAAEPASLGWTEALPPSFNEPAAPEPGPAGPSSTEAEARDDGRDEGSARIAWERRLYRLFKPARSQAKHLEGAQLSELIRKSVTEVRSR